MPLAPRPPRPAVSETATYTSPLTIVRYQDPRNLETGPKVLGRLREVTTYQKNRTIVNSFRSAGVHTPDYFNKVANHVFIPPTAADGRRSIEGLPVGEMVWDGGSVIAFNYGALPWIGGGTTGRLYSTTPYHGYDSKLPNRALIKCRLQLKDQAVNFAQAFAERRQTARLLEDTLRKFHRCISNLRRGRFRAAVAALELPGSASRNLSRDKTVAGNWLALQYGWKPLMSDLYGSAELLRSRDEYDPLRYRLYAKAGAASSRRFLPTYETHTWIRPQDISQRFGVVHRKAKVRLDYNLDGNRVLSLAKSAGFTNPLLLAWELTPFSFVADWAFPFGNYLSQLDATIGMVFLGGSLTERWEVRCGIRYLRLETAYDWLSFDFGAARTDSAWRRIPYTVEPFPNRPSFKDPVTAVHLANAAALISALRSVTR